MLFPAIWWGWSPPVELITFKQDPLGNLGMFFIPALILGTAMSAATMRMTRTRHATKNAFIPVLTLIGMPLPLLIGGSVILEKIFVLPGIGRLFLEALDFRDYPVVSAINLILATAAVNILVAGAAFGLSRFSPLQHQDLQHQDNGRSNRGPDSRDPDRQRYPAYVYHVILVVYGLSGFCALAYEVLWTRVLVFYVHSTTYAFTIMLSSFLLGIALGSLVFGRLIDKAKQHLSFLAVIEVLIGVFAILSIWEFSKLNDLMVNFTDRLPSWQMFVLARYVGAFLIMFIPTLLMGIAFPLASKIYSQNQESLGRYVGNIYSVNTVGSVLGSNHQWHHPRRVAQPDAGHRDTAFQPVHETHGKICRAREYRGHYPGCRRRDSRR